MPKYIIERSIPEAGALSAEDLKAISRQSCDILQNLGPQIQWVESYVTDDKLYCVYIASGPEMIRKHGDLGNFPVDLISEVRTVIGPATAEK
ncbi:MAG: DUF4242 domain-containing protein [Thermoanaerobaculia bacterium]|nr:DUF4242 domain-containing protein [Thermoanaerobaculia bacterium]